MPLKKGSSRAVVGENIKEMEAAGHPPKQSIAASLRAAGLAHSTTHKRHPSTSHYKFSPRR